MTKAQEKKTHKPPADPLLDKALPSSVDAERMVLASVLIDESKFADVASALAPEAFVLEKHRRLWSRMADLHARSEHINLTTLAEELIRTGQLESCDGVAYLSELTEGMPRLEHLDSYIRIVKEKALKRSLIFASQKAIGMALDDACSSADVLSAAQQEMLALGDDRTAGTALGPRQIIEEFQGGLNTFLDPSKRARGLLTGFTRLDEMTTGFQPGELIILAARPSVGKTALALNIAHFAALRHQLSVAIFSLEMSRSSLLSRMVCDVARVDAHRFRGGYLNPEERRRLSGAANWLVQAPLLIDDSSALGIVELHARARRIQRQHGLHLVVVDYLQLMSGVRDRTSNREQEVASISRGLKQLAKDLGVPLLALSQLSRRSEQRGGDMRPQLSDLRESGAIEQDADMVLFLFREELYKPDREDLQGVAELNIAKQRNGPTGKIELVFLHKFMRFENPLETIEGKAEKILDAKEAVSAEPD